MAAMPFTTETLRRIVRKHLPDASAGASFEPIRTGKFNTSYFVTTGEAEHVLRIAPPRDSVFCFYEREMIRQEPGLHRLLLKETSIPVARIIGFDDSLEIIDRDYILMERLPGEPLTEAGRVDINRVFRRVGECLAEAHRQHAQQYGYLGEHRPMEPHRAGLTPFASCGTSSSMTSSASATTRKTRRPD